MANEIAVSGQLTVSKGGVSLSQAFSIAGGAHTTMSGDQMISNVQIVGTSAEALSLVDVSTIGYVGIWNMDSTNFVEIALDSAVSTQKFAKLQPKGFALFPASTATMYAKADTANCNLLVVAIEL